MQAHTQLPHQVSGAQLGGAPQQTMATLPSQGVVRRRTWQTDADFGIRRTIMEKILQIFQRKRNVTGPSMHHKVSDFVKRLEDALYRDACSKEEYCDFSTLEQRLHLVAKRISPLRPNANAVPRGMNVAASPMIPTPGMPTMIPTPGHEITTSSSLSSFNFCGADNMMAVSRSNIGNMIPTPGLTTPSPGNSMLTSTDVEKRAIPQAHPQESVSCRLNGQMQNGALQNTTVCGNGSQRLGLQHLNNGPHNASSVSVGYPNASLYMNSGNMSAHSQYHQQHMPLQKGFPSNGLGMHCHGSSNMIPVPGMPVQQANSYQLQAQAKEEGGQLLSSPNQSLLKGVHSQRPLSSEGLHKVQHTAVRAQAHCDQQQEAALQHNVHSLLQASSLEHASNLEGVKEAASNCGSHAGSACRPNALSAPVILTPEQQRALYAKQQRWIIFLRHANNCNAPEGQCPMSLQCASAKQLLAHLANCRVRGCQFPRCTPTRNLIRHHKNCKLSNCPVCVPVRNSMRMKSIGHAAGHTSTGEATALDKFPGAIHEQVEVTGSQAFITTPSDAQERPAKRVKVESWEQNSTEVQTETPNFNTEGDSALEECGSFRQVKSDVRACLVDESKSQVNVELSSKCEDHKVKVEDGPSMTFHSGETSSKAFEQATHDFKEEVDVNSSSAGPDTTGNIKVGKSKNKGVSLIELFTPEQILEHIDALRQWVGQSKSKVEKNQASGDCMNENCCQLCGIETLAFEPPPIYCTLCGARIKRNALYFTMQCGETRHYFCMPCCNDTRSDSMMVDGQAYLKSRLEKRRNDDETEEPWVQCDKCEKWQHQICSLFNMRRNDGGQAEYTCPSCLLVEMGKGERKPLPQSAVLGAKDLPKTFLSDYIEQRLARRLKQERHERARAQGKAYNEVPGADSLVVRVVSCVDKKLEVKPQFLEMFQEEDYPTEFPYKSKVLLLFQKIEGVEVCLFGMYVQEFGSEAAQPNQRRVYLSYLDSVKYFRPDVRTSNGEALRTFVYHEILIGYLDYCKKRGFTSCYIWACPPLKGEDYILYCHPEIQKTPKSDKLRDWYLSMLSKAANEGIVAEVANMYDHFFVCTGEAKAKVTAARLPYFDGDYWPGAAEDMIMLLQKGEGGPRQSKKGKAKGAVKRATKASAQAELASNSSKDLQLMHKLGESIHPMKEDFIMVHLQHACTHCCSFILSGCRWTCRQCKNFQLCERCYAAEQNLDEWAMHPMNSKEAHQLAPKPVETLADTKDKDEVMESEFFDTRQAFLSLCQGNHYQYDTLRRAKNSSMMVLYHLHNPTAPAYVTTCNACHRDIETGQGWRCESCPDFDICHQCYTKDDSIKHPHKLVPHPSAADRETQSKEARQLRVVQLRKMLELLVHASQCGYTTQCQYPNCLRVKALFRHGLACRTRASGGCQLCKRMWYLLQLHARACKEAECRVPRCKDLKEHLRRLQQQQELRRRKAVMEMMRQRAALLRSPKELGIGFRRQSF
ncbi:hypothetical protein GOP47_0018867 [Adiantum capillus-veneris]|uniref:histone acetyltransferase n=1 Tax=Adiantum capillus-veneris TaxID=13818 RepID=A0A9D4UEY7_ADICA|nr:hypothetical protein GOP47_0018867 [Adiantum capillus-veneris]